MSSLPENCNLHLANSMSVRYANHIGLKENQNGVYVYGNRGTSGIDGCSSSAVGHALTSTIPNILITGDQAFFYDRNAFWHNYPIPNLFVVVLNNHGGIIFNMIDGPEGLPEAEEFFITRQTLKAKPLANEFGFSYQEGASISMSDFFKPNGNVKILEMESTQSLNKSVFESFKKQIKQNYEA
jgi:2-succinyl-5-enolpyruvyl-6-hydroxy-3-cyclohexene-1-carboxylate synthase